MTNTRNPDINHSLLGLSKQSHPFTRSISSDTFFLLIFVLNLPVRQVPFSTIHVFLKEMMPSWLWSVQINLNLFHLSQNHLLGVYQEHRIPLELICLRLFVEIIFWKEIVLLFNSSVWVFLSKWFSLNKLSHFSNHLFEVVCLNNFPKRNCLTFQLFFFFKYTSSSGDPPTCWIQVIMNNTKDYIRHQNQIP